MNRQRQKQEQTASERTKRVSEMKRKRVQEGEEERAVVKHTLGEHVWADSCSICLFRRP
jgi:hypothetical protein